MKNNPGSISETSLLRWNGAQCAPAETDFVATEEPLEIRVRGVCIAVVMRTPGHDQELAAGFLLSESVIRGPADVLEIAHCTSAAAEDQPNIINVFLAPNVEVDLERLRRNIYSSSSCGVCGKASIEAIHQRFPPVESKIQIHANTLQALPGQLRAAQISFERTGGLHAAAVFTPAGDLIVLREDVGRHNAVDKAIGFGLLRGILPFAGHVLLVSGRASFEIVQKALAARIPIVASVSAPSSLAVEFARDSAQTLIGFLRGRQFNVYTRPDRLAP